jgi:hypothetical protein
MTAVEDHPWQAFLPWCLRATTGLGNVDASIPWQKALTILLYGPEQAVHPKIRCQLRSHVCLHGKPITQQLARMIQIDYTHSLGNLNPEHWRPLLSKGITSP